MLFSRNSHRFPAKNAPFNLSTRPANCLDTHCACAQQRGYGAEWLRFGNQKARRALHHGTSTLLFTCHSHNTEFQALLRMGEATPWSTPGSDHGNATYGQGNTLAQPIPTDSKFGSRCDGEPLQFLSGDTFMVPTLSVEQYCATMMLW